jgi:DNA-binding PadR family transcriptional regulator
MVNQSIVRVEVCYELRTAELKKFILKISGNTEFYGYDIHRTMTERGVKIGIGRLYAVLVEMKNEKLLDDRWESSSSGPRRRKYQITQKGIDEREKILLEAIKTVHEFYTEYLLNLPPEYSAFEIIGSFLTSNLPDTSNIAYATSRVSEPIRRILVTLQKRISQGNLFIVGPRAELKNSRLESVSFLDGTIQDIPTRSGYLDLLIVTGNIKTECLDECLTEWSRVLTKTGMLALISPTALVTTYIDPLTIGDFVEKFEHPRTESGDTPDIRILEEKIAEYFQRVETKRVVHITTIKGFGPLNLTLKIP